MASLFLDRRCRGPQLSTKGRMQESAVFPRPGRSQHFADFQAEPDESGFRVRKSSAGSSSSPSQKGMSGSTQSEKQKEKHLLLAQRTKSTEAPDPGGHRCTSSRHVPKRSLTPDAAGGAVVFWVHPQVRGHVIRSPRPEATGGTLQQEHTGKTQVIVWRPRVHTQPWNFGFSPGRGNSVQSDHFVFGRRNVMTVNDNKPSSKQTDITLKRPTGSTGSTGSTRLLLDHVSGVRPRAAAAVRTQQTVHVGRVVGREVRDKGSTLHTPQAFWDTAGSPEGVQQKLIRL